MDIVPGDKNGDCLRIHGHHNWGPVPGFPQCRLATRVTNFFLARTDSVRAVGFDPVYSRSGHTEWERFNVDWAPTVNLGHSKKGDAVTGAGRAERAERTTRRRKLREDHLQAEVTKKVKRSGKSTTNNCPDEPMHVPASNEQDLTAENCPDQPVNVPAPNATPEDPENCPDQPVNVPAPNATPEDPENCPDQPVNVPAPNATPEDPENCPDQPVNVPAPNATPEDPENCPDQPVNVPAPNATPEDPENCPDQPVNVPAPNEVPAFEIDTETPSSSTNISDKGTQTSEFAYLFKETKVQSFTEEYFSNCNDSDDRPAYRLKDFLFMDDSDGHTTVTSYQVA
ncbi:B4GALNT2 [Branchiostoma lanceolatum]|uniref:B4GALNT2 protein n=1 Tax=Branchiostoma lanceolatum TaxID=7740 RepID=A0A8K0EFF6_BRALA|nr:B4GALNT2 [Branchiostoma lanceolatum]